MDCLRDLMATLTNQTLLVMVGSYPRHKRATIPRQTRAPPTISLCHCPQNTTAGRVWLYTLLYGNSLYRLYATAIHGPRIVPARPSRYTAYTAIQLYTLYSIQHYTASLRPLGPRCARASRRGAASAAPARKPCSAPIMLCFGFIVQVSTRAFKRGAVGHIQHDDFA